MSNRVPQCVCLAAWQVLFLRLLPQIRDYAIPAFGQLKGDDRDNAVQETIAQAFVLFVRLMHRGHSDRVFPTILARFAICRVRQGRTLGSRMNANDAMSATAIGRRGPSRRLTSQDGWLESIIEDYRTPVVDQVCFRIDYPEWLTRLPSRQRKIAAFLADGNTTKAAARQFRLSNARISQIRRELFESWENFHGEREWSATVAISDQRKTWPTDVLTLKRRHSDTAADRQ